MNITKALLIRQTDCEDGWVTGISIPVSNDTATFSEAFNKIKHILEDPQVIESVKNTFYLCDKIDDFENKNFEFNKVELECAHVTYTFINSDEEEILLHLYTDFISTVVL